MSDKENVEIGGLFENCTETHAGWLKSTYGIENLDDTIKRAYLPSATSVSASLGVSMDKAGDDWLKPKMGVDYDEDYLNVWVPTDDGMCNFPPNIRMQGGTVARIGKDTVSVMELVTTIEAMINQSIGPNTTKIVEVDYLGLLDDPTISWSDKIPTTHEDVIYVIDKLNKIKWCHERELEVKYPAPKFRQLILGDIRDNLISLDKPKKDSM